MSITAAEIESNGWVLRLTVTGSMTAPNTNFGAYALTPNGTPKMVLSSSHAGFVKSGGQAVSGSLARTLVATTPLRLPVDPLNPTVRILDETDLGGGSIRVRVALSETIYATDTGLVLNVLAGWRPGAPAQASIAVTNNSTIAAPLPIMRWAIAPYEVTNGSFRVSLFVVSHHPVGFEPVAAVKFTATDGTTTKTIWVTGLGDDNTYGDNLRSYTAVFDPAAAPALNAGLLRIDAEVYPWLGAMRSTDPAGTRSMSTLRTDALSAGAQAPWAIGYDPAGTRYGNQFVYVDTGGTTTASAAMVATTLAGAKAVAVASRAANIFVAKQALYLANKTLAAANGQGSVTRSGDGASIVLAPGQTHLVVTGNVTTGFQSPEIPVRIMGDPDDANPRANCLLRTNVTPGNHRNNKDRFQNLTLEIGGTSLSLVQNLWVDNCEVRARSGQTASNVGLGGAPAAGLANLVVTRTKWWRAGVGIANTGSSRALLVRATEASRTIAAQAIFKCRWIGNVEDGIVPGTEAVNQLGGWNAPTTTAQGEDWIAAFNDLRFGRAFTFQPSYVPAGTAGTPNPSMRRWAFVFNVAERIGNQPVPMYATGTSSSQTNSYNIIEGNTFVGDRCNTFYNGPIPTTLAEVDTQNNQGFVNRVANNAGDWIPTKHDDFNEGAAQTLRIAAGQGALGGYRPQLTEAWSSLFGVDFESNYDTARAATNAGFDFMWPGLNAVQNMMGASIAPQYTADGSVMGPGGTGASGGGNYLPLVTSPLVGRVSRGNSDRDILGTARRALATAGAFEVAAMITHLAPASARSGQFAAGTGLAIAFGLGPGEARSAQVAAFSAAVIGFGLAPTSAQHLHFTYPSRADWQISLGPGSARSPSADSGAAVGAEGVGELAPAPARHALPGGAVIILPDSGGAAAETLSVTIDLRTLSIR